jgi:uncharacterized phage infection (PIP) family protein YhgE
MPDYTNPVETTFELQRRSIEQSQEALEQTITLPTRVGEAALDSLDSQESVQRNVVETQQEAIHSFLDAIEETFPGVETSTEDVREVVDDQYDSVLEAHAGFFENLSNSLDEGFDAVDELSEETIEALDDLVDSLVEAQEELEDQSLEATEQAEEQFDELQAQVEDVQEQIQSVSEDAADAVGN